MGEMNWERYSKKEHVGRTPDFEGGSPGQNDGEKALNFKIQRSVEKNQTKRGEIILKNF
jgi:hypothetical protein